MSRLDESPSSRSRPRSNTTTAFLGGWRRARETSPVSQSQPTLPLEALIHALAPPAVPSLTHARQLASALSNASPLPPVHKLNGVFSALCKPDNPMTFQAAGFDVLSAYFENSEVAALSTGDRLLYFSLFTSADPTVWSQDLWEPRFKAFRSFSKWGGDLLSIEGQVVDLFQKWIQAAFDGLVNGDDLGQRRERERCIDILAEFLRQLMIQREIVSRLEHGKSTQVLLFHANFIYQSAKYVGEVSTHDPTTLGARPSFGHKRHPSSMSVSSSTELSRVFKTPFAIATSLYISYLQEQSKNLSPDLLPIILPPLFYALSICATPLPRLSVNKNNTPEHPQEAKITEYIYSLLNGDYAVACLITIRQALYPNHPTTNERHSHGAHRTLRLYVRRALQSRLVRAYVSREAGVGYTHSGAPGHMDLSRDLLEQAWPRNNGSGWDAARIGRDMARSVKDWINVADKVEREILEKILQEVAGTLRDILRELDEREDGSVFLDEEAWAFGHTLFNLASYLQTLG